MTSVNVIRDTFDKTDTVRAERLYNAIVGLINANDSDLTATWAEVNAVADMSGQVVAPATGDLDLTAALHGNRVVYYDDADGVISLPAATGSGIKYKVVIKTQLTTGSIEGLTASATFLGGLGGVDADADTALAYDAVAGDNTITGGTATGGQPGDWFEFVDIATNLYIVSGFVTQSGGSEATPFSAAS
jgi:hypothetical protein